MRRDSSLFRHECFLAAAAVAAHSNASLAEKQAGFRQRDVRFLVELCSNWAGAAVYGIEIKIQNVQIARYLSYLEKEGFARRVGRSSHPSYRLTRPGLLELMSRLVQSDYRSRPGDFLFVYFFVSTYKPRISALVQIEGREFPPALRIELESLLNYNAMLQKQMVNVKQELKKIEGRISDALKTSELTKKLIGQKLTPAEIFKQVEKSYPYELNSLKPLSELLGDIPADQRLWELECGTIARVQKLWEPEYKMLQMYSEQLQRLERSSKPTN